MGTNILWKSKMLVFFLIRLLLPDQTGSPGAGPCTIFVLRYLPDYLSHRGAPPPTFWEHEFQLNPLASGILQQECHYLSTAQLLLSPFSRGMKQINRDNHPSQRFIRTEGNHSYNVINWASMPCLIHFGIFRLLQV